MPIGVIRLVKQVSTTVKVCRMADVGTILGSPGGMYTSSSMRGAQEPDNNCARTSLYGRSNSDSSATIGSAAAVGAQKNEAQKVAEAVMAAIT